MFQHCTSPRALKVPFLYSCPRERNGSCPANYFSFIAPQRMLTKEAMYILVPNFQLFLSVVEKLEYILDIV
jgi:hypothetical protein